MTDDPHKNEPHTANSKTFQHNEGKNWPQILAVFILSLGSFTNGIQFTWSSPFSVIIQQDKVNYDLTEADTSLFMTFQPLGMVVTSFAFFQLSELLGRKKSILFLSVPQVLCWVVTIFAKTKWEFYVARFIAGIADTVMFCSIPPYIGEICDPTVRGFWGNIPTFVLYGGELFITIIGSCFNVQVSAYICIGIPVLFAISVAFLPESPYQLIRDGKMNEAQRSIRWLRRKSDVEDDFFQMKADVERQISESGTWMDLIKIPSNRKALRAGIFLRTTQHFSGIATFSAYTQSIFEKAGGSISPQHSSMIFLGLIWILNIFSSVSVEKFGRKRSFLYSVLGAGIILICMAVYFFIDQFQFANLDAINWFPLAGMVMYVFAYSFGLGVVPTLMLGELFSASIKSKGLGVLVAMYGVTVLLSNTFFHLLNFNVGLYSPFLLYSIICLVATILTTKWVPETKGKTLEEIQQSLKNGKNK